ncbi:HAD family hydrolase [Alkalicoccus chagannorensis]|uniref:HAD family hydrolase n=1 Tax=Alkalicoccus chagannorensis TaxID=427072 RepID=UPI0014769C96|nr:HAD family hydrolase [Alkalicoccus chagannorensis]
MKALFFDLDGTLLPMDTDKFVKQYVQELAPKTASLVDPQTFTKALWKGTEAMMKSTDPSTTNETVFMETFLPEAGVKREEIEPALAHFYEHDFGQFHVWTEKDEEAGRLVDTAYQMGYEIVIATNPLFPERAVQHRIEWAGINPEQLTLVSSYENSTFTKPHRQYYEELAAKGGWDPSDCIMCGNDTVEDLAAARAGMKTFLVEGWVIEREGALEPDDRGTLAELHQKLKRREGIFA